VPDADEFIDEFRRSASLGHARVFTASYAGGAWLGTGLATVWRRRGWPMPPWRHGRRHGHARYYCFLLPLLSTPSSPPARALLTGSSYAYAAVVVLDVLA
jgi:hypothetical protein